VDTAPDTGRSAWVACNHRLGPSFGNVVVSYTIPVVADDAECLVFRRYEAPIHILVGRVFVDKIDAGTEPFRYDGNCVALTRDSASKMFSGNFVPAFETIRIPYLVAKYPSYDVRLW